ncbi:MAG: DNA-3-methyladenine glycosylase I [Pseudomonadales bacterium]
MSEPERCHWATHCELEAQYHDAEWGRPCQDDRTLFEFLILEAAQAGLSWRTVLEKRDGYLRLYENFDVEKVAAFDQAKIDAMLGDPSIVRNKLKVNSSVKNAKVFIDIQREYGSFARYLWSFVDNKPIQGGLQDYRDTPVESDVSIALSKALKKRGMSFVGPTIMYAYMQAVGLVNDHVASCHCHDESRALGERFELR